MERTAVLILPRLDTFPLRKISQRGRSRCNGHRVSDIMMTDRGDGHQAPTARVRITAAGVTIHRLAAPSQPPAEADSPQPMDVEPIEEEEKKYFAAARYHRCPASQLMSRTTTTSRTKMSKARRHRQRKRPPMSMRRRRCLRRPSINLYFAASSSPKRVFRTADGRQYEQDLITGKVEWSPPNTTVPSSSSDNANGTTTATNNADEQQEQQRQSPSKTLRTADGQRICGSPGCKKPDRHAGLCTREEDRVLSAAKSEEEPPQQPTTLEEEAALHAPLLRHRPEPPPPPPPAEKSSATSPRAAHCGPMLPASCDKCVKILGAFTPARCFARVSERCRAHDGYNTGTSRWHHISAHEHFCADCAEHYSRGEARKLWQAEQAFGKCSHKEVVVRLHLPTWAVCTAQGCGKWRPLPPLCVRCEVRQEAVDPTYHAEWHCGLAELARGGGDLNGGIGVRARRKVHASCEHPLDPNAALTEPPEETGLAIPFVVLGARESDVKDAASDARLPWWDLSRLESATLAHHAELSQDMLSHPVRYVALRNLILYKWRENRAAGYVSH